MKSRHTYCWHVIAGYFFLDLPPLDKLLYYILFVQIRNNYISDFSQTSLESSVSRIDTHITSSTEEFIVNPYAYC